MTETINETTRPQDRLREKVSETRENIADMGHLAKETVQDKLHDLKDRASEQYDAGKDKLHELEATVVRQVRESPMKAVLIAAAVGCVFGYIWRRR